MLCITGQCSLMLLACLLDGMHGALSPQTSKQKSDVGVRACPLTNTQNGENHVCYAHAASAFWSLAYEKLLG